MILTLRLAVTPFHPPPLAAKLICVVRFVATLRDPLNIPLLVNHNEVAPSQHELSPIFALTNVSSDQNIICLQIMDEIAARHGVKVLQHEKPFAGVNGSGKHSNWGLNTDTGKNLFKPGKTEASQGDFFAFTAALACGPRAAPRSLALRFGSRGRR